MPRNYQRTKNNPYLLPHNLYVRTLYIIKDYDRLRNEIAGVVEASPQPPDGLPGSTGGHISATETKGIKIASMGEELHAIETALQTIPEFYREGVKKNIMYGTRYPLGADFRTFQRYKQRFVFEVAKNLNFI